MIDMYLVSTRKKYYFPEAFKDSADAYLSYREYIGISSKSIQISRLYLSRFFAFLNTKNVVSLDTVTVPIVLEFLKSLSSFGKPTINSIMRTVRYYLKYCHDNGIMHDISAHRYQ